MAYRLLPKASKQFFQILDNALDHRGEDASDELAFQLTSAFRFLAANPGIGHRREDFTSRSFYFHLSEPYLIVYSRGEDPLPIVAIYHAHRDIRRLLKVQ